MNIHRLFSGSMIIPHTLAVLCSGAICLTVSVGGYTAAYAESSDSVQNVNNLVLFAQFEDTADYNFMSEHTEEMIQMCSDTGTVRSLAGYIDAISYGQMQTECYFPQMQDSTVVPYTLSHEKDYYTDEQQIVLETIENVDIPDDIPLDRNGDGIIDNIIMVVDGEADSMSNILWPKAFGMFGTLVNGLGTGYVNIHNSSSLFENYISGGVGVLCHEFMHSIGYPDLYRSSSRSGNPVGLWDIMASNSVFLQYPLAYQRASVSGWLEASEITESGSYSLVPASSDSGDRLYILKTPLSNTEFFAVEYRQKGTPYSEEMDVKIYGTGLVVYRINTEVSGNYKSDRDEIYVFRPGETATDAGEGDIFSSYYGGEGMADEIGSLDFSDGVSDGALVYSDGTNSGIKISGITINEDDISFDVEFADTSSVSMWQTAGDISVNNSVSSIDIASGDSGVYLVTGFGTHADLHRFVNGEWVLKDSSIGNGDYGSVNNVKLAVCGTTPYVLYNDSDYNMVLCGYDESSGTWEKKVSGGELAQYTDLAAADGKLWIAYTTGSYPYVLNAACFDPETGEYTVIGAELAENACNISLSCSGGTAVIAYRDLNDGSKPKAAVYDGNSWKTVTVSEKSCGSVTAAASGDKIWVAFSGTNSGLCCIEGDSISEIAMPEGTEESCYTSIPVMAGGKLYLAVNIQDTPDFSVYVLTSSGWEKAGNTLAEDLVNDPSMICSGNTLYAAYITSSGTPVVKQYRIESEPLKGDVNLDGIVNIADAVMLQSHLLGKTALTSVQGENADVCEDNQLDVFDMSALRKLLLN